MAKKENLNNPENVTPQESIEDTNETATQIEEIEESNVPATAAPAFSGVIAGNQEDLFKTKLMAMWTSIPAEKPAAILKASQDADYNMMDYFDKNPGSYILVKDVLIHNVELLNEETGEMSTQARCVLIDTNGLTYSSVSAGVLSSLQKIFPLFGIPTWPDGLKISARRVKTRRFQTINLIVVD